MMHFTADQHPRVDFELVISEYDGCMECGHPLGSHGMTYWQTGIGSFDVGIRTVACYDCPQDVLPPAHDMPLCLLRSTGSGPKHRVPQASHRVREPGAKHWVRKVAGELRTLARYGSSWEPSTRMKVLVKEARYNVVTPHGPAADQFHFFDGSVLTVGPDASGRVRATTKTLALSR